MKKLLLSIITLFLIHHVMTYSTDSKTMSVDGHARVFYNVNCFGIIGLGAEYASAQNDSSFGNRLTDAETAVSLFFVANIGSALYLQNETAKGLINSRNFGFALTLKALVM